MLSCMMCVFHRVLSHNGRSLISSSIAGLSGKVTVVNRVPSSVRSEHEEI